MELTMSDLKELLHPSLSDKGFQTEQIHPFAVGEVWLFRQVTYHVLGRIKKVFPGFLELEQAVWVADSGRFFDALNTGELDEVEPMPGRVVISLGALTDAVSWRHALPREQK